MHGSFAVWKLHVGLLMRPLQHLDRADMGSYECDCPQQAEIEEALASGEWRAERTPGPQAAALGTSCPRF